jgi:hypothetical protein
MSCQAQVYLERWHLRITTIEVRSRPAVYHLVAVLTGFRHLELYWVLRLLMFLLFEMDSMIDRTMLPYTPRALAGLLRVL